MSYQTPSGLAVVEYTAAYTRPASPPSGPPVISLPSGFKPLALFPTLVKNYDFTKGLPTDWETIDRTNNGYQATEYMRSQVSFSALGALLTAIKAKSPDGYPYQSGWLDTAGKFLLSSGILEFDAMMPRGQGLWDGLWGLGPPSAEKPEIDVNEMLLGNPHNLYASAHDWNQNAQVWGETQMTTAGADLTQGTHKYQLVMQPNMLTWALDNVAYAQLTANQEAGKPWPFDTPMYLIANLAVAAASEWGGAPDATTTFPASLVLASVKVWQ